MKPNLAVVITLVWAISASAITIETVPVRDVSNANDPATGSRYGGVSYEYRIGKYEVTVGQYTAFLNAVAATDTYGLYNTSMALDLNIGGIARNGLSGSYTYSVISSPNFPVTYVNWADGARFANWLHNGQPSGLQDASTTEAGAYPLNGATDYVVLNAIPRNASAQWFIPSESEWYKAAYYQPAEKGGDADGYWNYPMRTNSPPYSDQPPGATPDDTRVGNFYQYDVVANGYDDGYAVTGSTVLTYSQNYLSVVGAYTSSPSYYGTFDQAGNVREWNEALVAVPFNALGRGARGGSWFSNVRTLSASQRLYTSFSGESSWAGFRVASIPIPEPSTLALTTTAFASLLIRRRK